ncbi:hypothetical protein [Streptomyces sp. ERV7]|uniref:hypothetical protein n=1 Tax=Streptomyces sp. ERV7 TaxID=1322334 RepID=UPI00131AD0BC|nr:hypothetical protein [Streptomyces sp. ERV7]
MVVLSGCSDSNDSVPSLPKSMCWGAFTGASVAPLLPHGSKAELSKDRPFDVFGARGSTYCSLFIDGDARFIAFAERRRTGKGTEWNGWARSRGTRIDAGDEAFVWDGGAGSVFLCERPDLPRSDALPKSAKYVELTLTANRAPETPESRKTLTALMQRYVDFAKRELKCAGGA